MVLGRRLRQGLRPAVCPRTLVAPHRRHRAVRIPRRHRPVHQVRVSLSTAPARRPRPSRPAAGPLDEPGRVEQPPEHLRRRVLGPGPSQGVGVRSVWVTSSQPHSFVSSVSMSMSTPPNRSEAAWAVASISWETGVPASSARGGAAQGVLRRPSQQRPAVPAWSKAAVVGRSGATPDPAPPRATPAGSGHVRQRSYRVASVMFGTRARAPVASCHPSRPADRRPSGSRSGVAVRQEVVGDGAEQRGPKVLRTGVGGDQARTTLRPPRPVRHPPSLGRPEVAIVHRPVAATGRPVPAWAAGAGVPPARSPLHPWINGTRANGPSTSPPVQALRQRRQRVVPPVLPSGLRSGRFRERSRPAASRSA